jgi:hypothetical protein
MQRRRFMPTYKHCAGCGRGYNQQAWQTESFCGSCSEPLKTGLRRDEPEEIHPYPDRDAPPNLRGGMANLIEQLCLCAKQHPFLFSTGAGG